MNRLLELQGVSGGGDNSAFTPTGADDNPRPSRSHRSSRNPVDDMDDLDKFERKGKKERKHKHSHRHHHRSHRKKGGDDSGKDDDDSGKPSAAAAAATAADDMFGPSSASAVVPIPKEDGDEDDDVNFNGTSAVGEGDEDGRQKEYIVQHDETLERSIKIIEEIQMGNRDIAAKTIELRAQSAENMKNFNPAAEADEGKEKIEELMDAVSMLSKAVKGHLDDLSTETTNLCKDEEMKMHNAATVKIQQNQHQHLTRQFVQYVTEYNQAVTDNEHQLREQAVRRIKLKYTKTDGTTCSDDEAREMAQQVLEMGSSDVLFQESKEVLDQVLETRRDIQRIERSMRELKQIMDDLSSLITEQGEIMDQVLSNVEQSVKYVKSGREQLKKAKEYAEKSSSKMKYLAACIGVLFLIVLVSTLGATIPTGGNTSD